MTEHNMPTCHSFLPVPQPELLPPESPLQMPQQDFSRPFRDQSAPHQRQTADTEIKRKHSCNPNSAQVSLWRILAFSPAMAATLGLGWIMQGWFADDGTTGLEAVLLVLIAFNFFWICFTVSTVVLGLVSLSRAAPLKPAAARAPRMRVALLMPVHNELPWYVLGNARSMLEELAGTKQSHNEKGHRFEMFILSDTRDPDIAAQEERSIAALRCALGTEVTLYYRRRANNTARKVGNITDWVRRWGGAYDAMLVLDADSLMSGRAILRLSDALARDPAAGLIQSFPQLIGARSVFGRMQQFANGIYGLALAEGLARWTGQEGNYWGHNAIIRTRAFAASAGLPELRAISGKGQQIMSHDFVEAGLLRRAGWYVRFLPHIGGSYEETPATLIDHIQRDRRWCQGNLQHLRLLGARGFHAMSRFHLAHGAIGYLMAPVWFALLVIWALIGRQEGGSVLTYFSETDPLRPSWPDMSEPSHVTVILLIYAMLLVPKLLAVLALPLTGRRLARYGGGGQLALSMLTEIALAILYAPVLMVQQMIAVIRSALGWQKGWAVQPRDGGRYGLVTLMKVHALESLSGLALWFGILAGMVSLWLMPIALSLVLAVPLSALSGWHLPQRWHKWMGTAEVFREPHITRKARHHRSALRQHAQALVDASPARPAQ